MAVTALFPTKLKHVQVTPIYKKRLRNSHMNFKPPSILLNVSKIMGIPTDKLVFWYYLQVSMWI